MKELVYSKPKSTLYIQARNHRLRIFRAGNSPQIHGSGFNENDPYLMQSIHSHLSYEIFFTVSGEIKIFTDYLAQPYQQSIVIIPPHLRHYTVPICGENYCLLFSFNDKIETSKKMHDQLQAGITTLPMTETIAFYIRQFCEKTVQNTSESESDANLLSSLIFSEIFSCLQQESPPPRSEEPSQQHIAAIDSFIRSNPGAKITLTDIANTIFLSPKQVSRIIKKEYGCSLSELLVDRRMTRAAHLLRNTELSITEITETDFIGISSVSYFCAMFKKKYGMSPLAYRKKSRQAQANNK